MNQPLHNLRGLLVRCRRPAQWAIGVLAVGLVVRLVVEQGDDLSRLLRFRAWHLVAILGLFFLQFLVSQLPFWLIIRRLHGPSVPLGQWIRIMSVSRMANNVVPQSGTIYRAVALKQSAGLSYTSYVQVFALFGWLTTLLDLLLAAVLVFAIMPGLRLWGLPAWLLMAGALLVLSFGPILARKVLDALHPGPGVLGTLHTKLHALSHSLVRYGTDRILVAHVVVLMVVRFGLCVLLFRLLFAGMDVTVGYAHVALLMALQQFSGLLTLTPGNIGVRELAYGMVGHAVGIGLAQGVMASALLRAAQYMVVFPLGLCFGGWRLLCHKSPGGGPPGGTT